MEAKVLAKYIIAKSDNVGDPITNKKLQKLLYYVKAWGLVYFTNGIISDQFEAWIHGPVCPAVYAEYKKFGYSPIELDYKGMSSSQYIRKFEKENFPTERDKEKAEMIDVVFKEYATHSSLELELLSHTEEPWLEAREGLSPIETGHVVIKESTMERFYSSKLHESVSKH